MRTIKAVLFDLDGVVAFTDRFHFQAWKELCEEQGWDFDEQVNHACRGVSRIESLQVILDHNDCDIPEPLRQELAERKNQRYRELLERLTAGDLYPGIVPFLKCLRSKGVRVGLGSASRNAQWILEKLNIHDHFDVVVTGVHTRKPKPDPEVFLLGARQLGVHPFNCLVFEDAVSGVAAALSAKMKCIGVGKASDLPMAPATIERYEDIDIDHLLECGLPRQPPCDPWIVAEEQPLANRQGYHESIFCLANGRMGLRGTYDSVNPGWKQWSRPGFFLNGLYEKELLGSEWNRWDGQQRESSIMLNLCDWRTVETSVGGETLEFGQSQIRKFHRKMDMREGLVDLEFKWQPGSGGDISIRSRRLVSMTRLDTAAQCIEWTSSEFIKLVIRSEVIHRTFTCQFGLEGSDVQSDEGNGGDLWFSGITRRTLQNYVLGLRHQFSQDPDQLEVIQDDEKTSLVFRFSLKPGQVLRLEKFAVASGFPDAGDLKKKLQVSLDAASEAGFDTLSKEESQFWQSFWEEHDVEVEGDDRDQQAIRFCIYHLRRNHPACSRRSISATGVTGSNYMGWVFWDTELFMLPFFNFTDPSLACKLLEYRIEGLSAARDRAAEHGAPGALYPWSTIDGHETNFDTFVALAQFHINPDIVFALRQYADTHGDWSFLKNRAAPLIFETARGMASLGRFLEVRNGQFCIHAVCGPDEYNFPVNNNAFTNEMTRYHMETAVKLYEHIEVGEPELLGQLRMDLGLEVSEVEEWRRIAENMFVPMDESRGIHAQDDQYLYKYPDDLSHLPRNYEFKKDMDPLRLLRMQVTKQADVVLLMMLLRERFNPDIRRANFDFYEPRTRHASSLSPAVHSVVAADVGQLDKAYAYFREAVSMDLDDRKHNTGEGLHFACMGSSWMAAVQGFGGLRQHEGSLSIDPRLPKEWRRLRYRFLFQGSRFEVDLSHENSSVRLLEGGGAMLLVADDQIKLSPQQPERVWR